MEAILFRWSPRPQGAMAGRHSCAFESALAGTFETNIACSPRLPDHPPTNDWQRESQSGPWARNHVPPREARTPTAAQQAENKPAPSTIEGYRTPKNDFRAHEYVVDTVFCWSVFVIFLSCPSFEWLIRRHCDYHIDDSHISRFTHFE